jgi:phosphate transport system substrate-binding protein
MKRRQFLTAASGVSAGLMTSAFSWPFAERRAEPLLIAGSTNVQPFTKELLEVFAKQNPDVEIVNEGGGSLAGLIALKRGAIDIAALSREIKRSEDDPSFNDLLFAKDAVAVTAHPGNPVTGLSRAQVRDVLAGRITDWSALGGPAGLIEVVNRAPGSTTRKWVEENVMGHDEILRHAPIVTHASDMATTVANNPRAFGYLASRDLTDRVRLLAVDGVAISRATVYSGRYPLTRSMYYVVKGTGSRTARRFLDFVLSAQAQERLEPELMRVN